MICMPHQILFAWPNQGERKRRVGHVALMGDRMGTYRVLVGKSEGKTPLGRPTRRRENNIRMD